MGMEVRFCRHILLPRANRYLFSIAYPSMATLFLETREFRLPDAAE